MLIYSLWTCVNILKNDGVIIIKAKDEGSHSLSKTILYIDDSEININLLKQIVSVFTPYTFISETDPFNGLTLAEEKLPDIILMDIHMPGMTGYEALEKLQQNETIQHIPVIAVSADAMSEDIEKGKLAGFSEYITKPFNIKALVNVIDEILVQ